MNKELTQGYVRVHTMNEEGKKSFALIGIDENNDSCVTLVRCDSNDVSTEMGNWGFFTKEMLNKIEELDCGEQYYADPYSLIMRLS